MVTTEAATGDKYAFKFFPEYARFIRENHLVPYIQEQIRISREIKLPMLRFFEGMSDADLITMAIDSHKEFLTAAEENRLEEQQEKGLALWKADGLGIMKREEVTAEDITLAGFMRKKALLKFLPGYTTDVSEAVEIIKEIDFLTVEGDTAATNIYINLLKDRINEESFFSERLAHTTPGLNYVLDVNNNEVKYVNKNAEKFLNHSLKELQEISGKIIEQFVHPEDVQHVVDCLAQCALSADKEVVSCEFRIKAADGSYIYMRNYVSVFKRNNRGDAAELVGIILDVSKEKEIAEQLLYREQQLLDAQAQAMLGSFELDVATGKMDVTPQFKKIYELDDFDLYNLIDHVHPADRDNTNNKRDKAIQENGIYDTEYRYLVNGKEKVLWSRGKVNYKNGKKLLIGTVMDVTGRHKMIREIEESRDLYKQAQQLARIGNWAWDLATNVWTWSDELYHIYNMEPQPGNLRPEITKTYRHPDDNEMVDEQIRILRELHIPCDVIFRMILPDGTTKHLHLKGDVRRNEEGKVTALFGTIQDVTEKQELIDRLQRSEQLYKQAQAIASIGNWSWDMATKQIEWSDEIYNIYELPHNSVQTSATLDEYNHPDDNDLIRNSIRTAIEQHKPFDFNYRIILKSGRTKILHAKGGAEHNPNGGFKIYGTLQDITVQKNIERQLKDYKEFIEKITDVTPSIITTYNVNTGEYSFINDAIDKFLGYAPIRVMEEGVAFMASIVHPDDIQSLMEKNTKALEDANQLTGDFDEPVVEFKFRMRNAEGEYRWFHTYATIFERNELGLVESVLNISIDITDQEEAEKDLYTKNIQLQQSNTSLEEYAYVASHDLKEPLRKIVTFSDRMLATQQATLNEDGKLYLDKIITAAMRMQTMINDLLAVSTIMGNTSFEPTDLNTILEEALIALDHKIEETNALVEHDDLPNAAIVPSQFRQLFQNLVNNSLKFARAGVPPHIKITSGIVVHSAVQQFGLAKSKEYLRIKVRDNGIGFDDQYAAKIFAIFQRLHGRSEYEGTGIGLAICKKIAENHGGTIVAHGVVNEGATFTIIIPLML
jgi:PAS domain S-box-containing protein